MNDRLPMPWCLYPAPNSSSSEAHRLADRTLSGSLAVRRMALAAYCGDPAAEFIHGRPSRAPTLTLWLEGLDRWGHDVWLRAAIAAADAALPGFEHSCSSRAPHQAVRVAQACLETPCPALLAISEQAATRAAAVGVDLKSGESREVLARATPRTRREAAYAAAACAHTALAVAAMDPRRSARLAVRAATRALGGETLIWEPIRRALASWALSEPDEEFDFYDDAE